jgi:hypothetical protein
MGRFRYLYIKLSSQAFVSTFQAHHDRGPGERKLQITCLPEGKLSSNAALQDKLQWLERGARMGCEKRRRMELPEDLRQMDLVAKVSLQSMWMMSKEYGFVLLCTDLQVRSSVAECPFDEAGDFVSAFGGA